MLLTHQQFLNKYVTPHKPIDEDGAFRYQCLDIVKQYAKEVIWCRLWYFSNKAVNGRKNTTAFPWGHRQFITPWPWHDMKQGDIFIWTATQKYKAWHIGIVDTASNKSYRTIEQNAWKGWWDGKWLNAPHMFDRPYNERLLGFVRYVK